MGYSAGCPYLARKVSRQGHHTWDKERRTRASVLSFSFVPNEITSSRDLLPFRSCRHSPLPVHWYLRSLLGVGPLAYIRRVTEVLLRRCSSQRSASSIMRISFARCTRTWVDEYRTSLENVSIELRRAPWPPMVFPYIRRESGV